MANPEFVYKILLVEQANTKDFVPASELDIRDGYIHLSTSHQVPRTCKRFFHAHQEIVLFKIKYSEIQHLVKWELAGTVDAAENYFPHVYGQISMDSVKSTTIIKQKDTGFDFEDFLK